MKKLAIGLASAFVVIALVVMLIFVLFGNEDSKQPDKKLNLEGTWRVVSNINGEIVSIVENEYMIFNDKVAYDYKGDVEKPYVESKYTLNGDNLKLTDISREYVLSEVTDNILCLYETPEKCMYLVKYPTEEIKPYEIKESDVQGKWTVICHAGTKVSGEAIAFNDEVFELYTNGETKASSTATFQWTDDSHIIVDAWSIDVVIHFVTESVMVLVETDTGYTWELVKE